MQLDALPLLLLCLAIGQLLQVLLCCFCSFLLALPFQLKILQIDKEREPGVPTAVRNTEFSWELFYIAIKGIFRPITAQLACK